MASKKQDFKIPPRTGVTHGGKTYRPGQENDLKAAIAADQIDLYLDNGTLSALPPAAE